MARHLSPVRLENTHGRGRAVECFPGAGEVDGRPTLRWLDLRLDHGEFVASLFEAFDPQDPELMDLQSFEWLGEHGDEPIEVHRFATLAEALDGASRQWGADPTRWTNEGVVEGGCEDFLAAGRRLPS